MSERYSRLFALSGESYTPGAPVTLAAGALLKDNQTGKVLAQLKLRSISPKTIKAAKVQIIPMDTVGRPLGEPVEHAYLDLTVSRNVDFGQKSAIMLPDAECRRFSARVTEVAFGDNTVWSSNGEWKPLPYARPLQEALPDVELYKQYRLTYGNQCRYLPLEHEDLWYCGCGALNRKEEGACHHCGLELFQLKTVDWAALDVQKNARVAAEQAEAKRLAEEQAKADAARRAEEARQQEIAAAKAKKKKKTAAICAVLAVAVCAAAYVVTQIILPAQAQKEAYAKAQELFDAGNYSSASEMFSELGDYEDSAEMYMESRYQSAMAAFDEKNATSYAYAQTIFEKLGNYKDSATMVYECKYQMACALYENKQYSSSFEIFETIEFYKDSSDFLKGYVSATIDELWSNPSEYDGLNVEVSGFVGNIIHNRPTYSDDYYDGFLVKRLSHVCKKTKSEYGFANDFIVAYEYWQTLDRTNIPYVGIRILDKQYKAILTRQDSITIKGYFTHNYSYLDEGNRTIDSPHGYDLLVHSYTVE